MKGVKVLFTDITIEDRERIRLDGCSFRLHGPTRSPQGLVDLSRDVDVVCMRDQFVKGEKHAREAPGSKDDCNTINRI